MKAIISLIGAAFLLAGCEHSDHRGGSYSDYPYHHHGSDRYDGHRQYDRNYGYYDSRGRYVPYSRNYNNGYYDKDGRFIPYDQGQYRR